MYGADAHSLPARLTSRLASRMILARPCTQQRAARHVTYEGHTPRVLF